MIRQATLDDIPAIVWLTRSLHKKSKRYGHTSFNEEVYKRNLRMMINNAQYEVLVGYHEAQLVGFIVGITQPIIWSLDREATDYLFYVKPRYGITSSRIMARFLSWARGRPKVRHIIMGITNDLVDEEKAGALYERYGLERAGTIYMARIDTEDCHNERCG